MKWKDISELNNEKVSKEVLVKVGLFGSETADCTKYALELFTPDDGKIHWIAYTGRIKNYKALKYICISDIE